MAVIRKATIKSYDAQAHRATVQIAGSLGVWLDGIRVATDIPAADVVADRECTVLFLDPSNPDDALVLTIQGAVPSGGGGSTTFLGLTDTPASYASQALKSLRVNAGETALEFHDPYASAHTWAALQTFGAGLKLAAGQQLQDSGGTGRILPAAASPHLTLTGDVQVNTRLAIDGPVKTSPDTKINIAPTLSGASGWTGIDIGPSGTATGALIGIRGSAQFTIPAGSGGSNIYGLQFLAAIAPAGAASNVNLLRACIAQPSIVAIGSGKSTTITEFTGLYTDFANLTVILATATLTAAHALYIPGASLSAVTCNAFYGIRLGDFTGVTGTNRLVEIGPSTPYLRLVGGAAPGANLTNLYLNENGTLRRVQWKDGASIGAGDRVMVLV